MPVRFTVTEGTCADCTQAIELIQGFEADYLMADKAYDVDELLVQALEQNMEPVIPSKKNRREPRQHDQALYKPVSYTHLTLPTTPYV